MSPKEFANTISSFIADMRENPLGSVRDDIISVAKKHSHNMSKEPYDMVLENSWGVSGRGKIVYLYNSAYYASWWMDGRPAINIPKGSKPMRFQKPRGSGNWITAYSVSSSEGHGEGFVNQMDYEIGLLLEANIQKRMNETFR